MLERAVFGPRNVSILYSKNHLDTLGHWNVIFLTSVRKRSYWRWFEKKRIKCISRFHLFLWQDTGTAVFVPKNKQKFDTIYFKVYIIKGNVPKVCPFSSWNSKNTSNKQYINFRSMEETKYWLLALLRWRLEKCHKNSVPLYHDL